MRPASSVLGLLLVASAALAGTRPAPQALPSFKDRLAAGIVTVRVTGQEWNWKTPWAKQGPWTRSMTGLVVPGPKILVASAGLGNHLLIEVQKDGRDARTPARLALVDHEGPLGLIEVDDPAFWKGLSPLLLAPRPPGSGAASVHRWSRSGLLDSATGTVRQVRAGRHGFSRVSLLTLDVTATMEGGGDSEVVAAGEQVIGLATGKAGDQLAVLASSVLRQFLDDAGSGSYRGFARAGIGWQDLTNPDLRAALGLASDEGGIRLTRVLPRGSGADVLKPGDVILEIAGHPLDPTGQFDHPVYGRLAFPLLFSDGRQPGDALPVKVLRDDQRQTVSVTLRRMVAEDDRIPPYVFGRGPDYAVVGGLVFQAMTGPYLSTWGDWSRRAPPRLLIAYDREGQDPSADRPRIILLSSVLPDATNLGYQDLRDLIVDKVNGRTIGSMDDLRQAFAEPRGGFHVVEFLPGQSPGRIVLDATEAQAAAGRIRTAYGVPATP
jgi:PDZ domain-containing protein